MRVAPAVELDPEQKATLEQRSRARSLPARVVERARIVLLAAAGKQDKEIAADRISVQKSARWRARFLKTGVTDWRRTLRVRDALRAFRHRSSSVRLG